MGWSELKLRSTTPVVYIARHVVYITTPWLCSVHHYSCTSHGLLNVQQCTMRVQCAALHMDCTGRLVTEKWGRIRQCQDQEVAVQCQGQEGLSSARTRRFPVQCQDQEGLSSARTRRACPVPGPGGPVPTVPQSSPVSVPRGADWLTGGGRDRGQGTYITSWS